MIPCDIGICRNIYYDIKVYYSMIIMYSKLAIYPDKTINDNNDNKGLAPLAGRAFRQAVAVVTETTQ